MIFAFSFPVFSAGDEIVNLVAFGDSNTFGKNVKWSSIWSFRLQKTYKQDRFINSGKSGNTALDLLDRLQKDVYDYYREGQRNIVIVNIGVNDLYPPESDPDIVFDDIEIAWSHLSANNWELWASTITPVTGDNVRNDKIRILNKKIRKSGIPYIDGYKIFVHPDDNNMSRANYIQADGTHWSGLGHRKFYNSVKKKLF